MAATEGSINYRAGALSRARLPVVGERQQKTLPDEMEGFPGGAKGT